LDGAQAIEDGIFRSSDLEAFIVSNLKLETYNLKLETFLRGGPAALKAV